MNDKLPGCLSHKAVCKEMMKESKQLMVGVFSSKNQFKLFCPFFCDEEKLLESMLEGISKLTSQTYVLSMLLLSFFPESSV